MWYAIRRASAHIIVLSSYSPFVKYTPQLQWLRQELKRVDREKTPWLIVLMHIPIYNSNDVHFMEGESMQAVFEEWFAHHKADIVFAGHVLAYERSVAVVTQYRKNQLRFTSLLEMVEIRKAYQEDSEILFQSILRSEKQVMVIRHRRSEIGHIHSTIGIAMMMGKKCPLTRLYYTVLVKQSETKRTEEASFE